MPRIIDIVIRGSDQSGPAFASAATNLARLTTGTAPAVTGLARIENQATETGSAIITLGIAGSTTATRMRSLNVSIINQEQALRLAEQRLHEVRAAHDADSLAVGRAQLAYDRLNRSLVNNRARMQDLRTSGDISGISVIGAGGAAAGGAGSLAGGLTGLQGAAGALGFAFGTSELVRYGGAAIGAANDVERIETTIRALSGSLERYNEVVALARENQMKFGGTTAENLESFRALIPVTNALNVEISDLDKTRRLLGAYQPESAEQAGRAIREFLTGTGGEASQSLQMIFELDKRRLDAIVASTDDATERNKLLREVARIGVTEQLITDQITTRAAAYDRMWSAVDRAQTAIGAALGDTLLPYVETITGLLNIATGDVSGGFKTLQGASAMMAGSGGQTFMQSAMLSAAGQTQPTVVQNITVQGSLVTERQLADTTRRLNSQTAARNGVQTRR